MKYSLRNFAITFVISLVIFGAIAWAIVGALKNMTEDILKGDASKTEEKVDPSLDEDNNIEDDAANFKGKTFTFLAVGMDKLPISLTELQKKELKNSEDENNNQEEDISDPFSSMDAIMLIRADKENKKFVFISLPSDFIINYNGENMPLKELTKRLDINDPKDLSALLSRITAMTGLAIDYYAFMDMEAFVDTIDSLGGITYTVPQKMKYEDPFQDLKIDFKKNQRISSGEDILKMLRFVTYNGTIKPDNVQQDLDFAKNELSRTSLQMNFLNAILKKMLTIENAVNVSSSMPKIFDTTKTNFDKEALKQNVDLIFSYKNYDIKILTYAQSYVKNVFDKYSEVDLNKDTIKTSIRSIAAEISKIQ